MLGGFSLSIWAYGLGNNHTGDYLPMLNLQELFGDIGKLCSAKLTGSGVAEVVFDKKEDAEASVEEYHLRQLDGQAMKCKLVLPSSPPTRQVFI